MGEANEESVKDEMTCLTVDKLGKKKTEAKERHD